MPRLFLDFFNLGVHRTHYYNVSMDNWGDIRPDGTPRPSLLSVKHMIDILQDPGHADIQTEPLAFGLSGDTANLRHTLLQKNNGTFYLVLWLDARSYDTSARQDIQVPAQRVTVELESAASEVNLYRPITTTRPVRQERDIRQIEVSVPDHPVILEIRP